MKAMLDTRVRCPICESYCQILCKGVSHMGLKGWYLYGCSDYDKSNCPGYVIVRGCISEWLNREALQELVRENRQTMSDLKNLISQLGEKDVRLGARLRRAAARISDEQRKKKRLEAQINRLDTQVRELRLQLQRQEELWRRLE